MNDFMEIFLFWYIFIVNYIVVAVALYYFILAIRLHSRSKLIASIIIMIPNVIWVSFEELDLIYKLNYLFFLIQIIALTKIKDKK